MHDVPRVRLGERAAELFGHRGGFPGSERLAPQAVREALALHQLRDVVEALGGMADVEDLDDARIADAREQLRLALEAASPVGILGPPGLDHLDRDRPLQAAIQSPVDAAERALADYGVELVAIVKGTT